MTFSIPASLAAEFSRSVPARQRSQYLAEALRTRLAQRDQELAAACDVVVSVVVNAAQTEEVLFGPQRNGVSTERGLIDEWPQKGLPVVWRSPGGVGTSGVGLSRGRAITLWQDEDEQFVAALDAVTGRVIWKTTIASARVGVCATRSGSASRQTRLV